MEVHAIDWGNFSKLEILLVFWDNQDCDTKNDFNNDEVEYCAKKTKDWDTAA